MAHFITPPDIVATSAPVVFLAGPIQGAPEWQIDAARMLMEGRSDIVVASPRKDYAPGTFVYETQVDWESEYLRRAGENGVVLFWLAKQAFETPGRPYAQTSRFELGEWFARAAYTGARLAVGVDEGFTNARYIKRRFGQQHPNVAIHGTLEATCEAALDAVRGERQTATATLPSR